MRHLQPVFWAKGTFLAPQHLQIQDRYIENLLQFQLESVTNYLWGFAKLEIDREKLKNGEFCISELRGIFPDGLLFDIPDADDPVTPRVIKVPVPAVPLTFRWLLAGAALAVLAAFFTLYALFTW